MKLLLTLLFTLTMFSANAQWADTTANARIDHINLQLDKAHKQFRNGTAMVIIGLAISGVSTLADSDGGARGFLAGFGSLLLVTGTVIHIDSHKYIGRTRLDD